MGAELTLLAGAPTTATAGRARRKKEGSGGSASDKELCRSDSGKRGRERVDIKGEGVGSVSGRDLWFELPKFQTEAKKQQHFI